MVAKGYSQVSKIILSSFILTLLMSFAYADNIQVNIYNNNSDNRYSNYDDYYNSRNIRPRLKYRGVWVESNSGVYYSHSSSRLKNARHAARIDYYNSKLYD